MLLFEILYYNDHKFLRSVTEANFLEITISAVRLGNLLRVSWRRLEIVLPRTIQLDNMPWKPLEGIFANVLRSSWRRFQNTLNIFWKCLQVVFARHLEDYLARRLEEVLKRLKNVFKVFLQDVLKMSRKKRLEDVLETYDQDKYIGLDQEVLKTSWRRLLNMYE